MMDEKNILKNVIFTLFEKNVFQNIDVGLPFYFFILDDEGKEYLPIQYRECKETDASIDHKNCLKFWKKQLELGSMIEDVVFAKCPAGFGTLLIPLKINEKFVGIIGGCVPKKNIPERAVEKTIALFRGISQIIEILGNKEFYNQGVIKHLTQFITDVHSGYSIEDSDSIFFSPVRTIQKIIGEFSKMIGDASSYIFLKTGSKDKYLLIDRKEDKFVNASDGIDYFIEGIKFGDILGSENPLFMIYHVAGLLFPIATNVKNIGFLFIEKNSYIENIEDIKKYIELITLLFSSIYSNSILFDSIAKRGKEVYEQEILNYFKIQKIVYYYQNLINTDISSRLELKAGNELSVYIKDNLDQRDDVFRNAICKNDGEYYKKGNDLLKSGYELYRDYLYIKKGSASSELSEEIYGILAHNEIYKMIMKMYHSYIYTIPKGIEIKDPFKSGHIERIIDLAEKIGLKMKLKNVEIENMRFSAYLMDIGLLGVPDKIIESTKKLSISEYEQIKRHVNIGIAMLKDADFSDDINHIVKSIHENWDGSGYPNRLKEEDIPFESRILHICETFITLIGNRKFRTAMDLKEVVKIIENDKGKAFDPKIVDIFMEIIHEP